MIKNLGVTLRCEKFSAGPRYLTIKFRNIPQVQTDHKKVQRNCGGSITQKSPGLYTAETPIEQNLILHLQHSRAIRSAHVARDGGASRFQFPNVYFKSYLGEGFQMEGLVPCLVPRPTLKQVKPDFHSHLSPIR